MTELHRIRLHGPWQLKILEQIGSDPPHDSAEFQARIPSDWGRELGADFRGTAVYRRGFHRPTGLDSNQRVELVVEQVDFQGSVILNGHELGTADLDREFRQPIQAMLMPFNELTIRVTLPGQVDRGDRNRLPGGLIGGVQLEIHPSG